MRLTPELTMHADIECQIGIFMISAFGNSPIQTFQAPERPSRLIGSGNSVEEGIDIQSVAMRGSISLNGSVLRLSRPVAERLAHFANRGDLGFESRPVIASGDRIPQPLDLVDQHGAWPLP
jgi:hypothetical protein